MNYVITFAPDGKPTLTDYSPSRLLTREGTHFANRDEAESVFLEKLRDYAKRCRLNADDAEQQAAVLEWKLKQREAKR